MRLRGLLSYDPRFLAKPADQLFRRFGRRAGDHLRLLALFGHVEADDLLLSRLADAGAQAFRISFFLAAMIPLSVA